MPLRGWFKTRADRQRAVAMRHVQPFLEPGEGVEVAINGLLGTVSGSSPAARKTQNASPAIFLNAGGAIDGYEVVLTTSRLLALRAGVRVRGGRSIALSNDRRSSQAVLVRRRRLFDRVQLGFEGCSLSLTVHRVFREDVDRLVAALSN